MKKYNSCRLICLACGSILLLAGCINRENYNTIDYAKELVKEDRYTLAGDKHLVYDYPSLDPSGNINVVIEVPAGTNDKWEVNKSSGKLKWEFKNDQPRIVSYLGYPGNYGMIPSTILPKEFGGDGDPLDVLILGPALPRGRIVSARPIGVLRLLDRGEQDDKIIAVLLDSQFGQIKTLKQLNREFKGVTEIIQIWFSNYKGIGKMQSQGFADVEEAQQVIQLAIKAFDENKSKSGK